MWLEETRTLWLWENSAGRPGLEKQHPSNVEHGHAWAEWQEPADTQKRNFQNGPNAAEGHQRVAAELNDEESCDLCAREHSYWPKHEMQLDEL